MRAQAWHDARACAGELQPLWDYSLDPMGSEHADDRAMRLRAGRRICRSCPVQTQCFIYAISKDTPPVSGMWGGVLFNEEGKVEHLPKRPRRSPPLPEPAVPSAVMSQSTSESKTVALEATRERSRITIRAGHAVTRDQEGSSGSPPDHSPE